MDALIFLTMQSALLKYRSLRPHSRLGCAAILIFCCALKTFGVPSTSATTEARPTEYEVKAAYLFNFTKFVKWPEPAKGATFDLFILGANPFSGALASIVEGESVGDQKIVVRRISNAKAGGRPFIREFRLRTRGMRVRHSS